MIEISLSVNGTETTATVDERCLLVDFLRDQCGLLGARNGCYEARCGCCSVLLDEEVVKSCNVLAAQASGRSVRTVEALTPMGYESIADPTATGSVGLYEPLRARGIDATALHPLQAAFHAH